MKRSLFIVWTLAFTYCANGPTLMAETLDQGSFEEKWLIEAKKQWQDYLSEMSHYEVKIEVEQVWNRSIIDKEPETQEFHAVVDYPRSLLYSYCTNSDRVEEVKGVNSEYDFRLNPAKNDPEKWIVARIARVPPKSSACQFSKASVYDIDAPCDSVVNQYLANALAIQTTLIPSLVELDGFKVASVKESTRDGQRIASIAYEYEPKAPPRKVHTRSGTVHLLVDHYWLVDSADFIVGDIPDPKYRNPFSVRNTYNFTDFRVPVLTSSEWKCFNNTPDKTWRYSMTFVFRFQPTQDRSPGRFTLTAFGLPEVDFGSQPHSYRRWLVIVIAIVAIVVLCVILLKRRRMAKSVTI